MKNLQNTLSLAERLMAPTPKLFQIIRNLGITLGIISGAIMSLQTQGVELPPVLDSIGSIASTVAGLVAALVSQLTVDLSEYKKQSALG